MTVREILKILNNDGWYKIDERTKGSHIQLKHPTKKARLQIPITRATSPQEH